MKNSFLQDNERKRKQLPKIITSVAHDLDHQNTSKLLILSL